MKARSPLTTTNAAMCSSGVCTAQDRLPMPARHDAVIDVPNGVPSATDRRRRVLGESSGEWRSVTVMEDHFNIQLPSGCGETCPESLPVTDPSVADQVSGWHYWGCNVSQALVAHIVGPAGLSYANMCTSGLKMGSGSDPATDTLCQNSV